MEAHGSLPREQRARRFARVSDSSLPVAGAAHSRKRRVFKRVAQFGFLFFLLKGLGWLVVGWLAWKGLR